MNTCIPLVCSVVAVAAAVRSTWSPCGLSMLSTITPFSERARGHSYGATSAWFVTGATAGGASLGVMMAGLAFVVRALHPGEMLVGVLAVAASLVATVSDSATPGFRIPFHGRQVNERWLDHFRPSIYGIGFGWQIGTGVATYITTAAVYLMIVLGALTSRPLVALAVGTGFGMLRGAAVLLTRRVTDPSRLRTFHRRFLEIGPVVGRIIVGVELVSAMAIAGWLAALSLPAVIIAVVAAGLVVVVTVSAGRIRTARGPGDPAAGPPCPAPAVDRYPDRAMASAGPASD